MNLDKFMATLDGNNPPEGIGELAAALWWEAKGDWDRSHHIAQDVDDTDGAWVHAYLHRKEGDEGNAGYWYRRAGKPFCKESLQAEWESLAEVFLQ